VSTVITQSLKYLFVSIYTETMKMMSTKANAFKSPGQHTS